MVWGANSQSLGREDVPGSLRSQLVYAVGHRNQNRRPPNWQRLDVTSTK